MTKLRYFILFLLVFSLGAVNAQDNIEDSKQPKTERSSDDKEAEEGGEKKFTPEPLEFVFRPKLSIGTGMFTFYGDVGNRHAGYHPTVSRLGYDLRLINPIDEHFDLSFYVLFGQVSANERSLTRNANFNSNITTGGATITYNFGNLIGDVHRAKPYISLGLESVEFLSKTDLYDKDGKWYFYWSDGRIMDLDENDPGAAQFAQELQRDYVYESDLRELDLDGFGKYQERTWAIPLEFGMSFDISNRLDFRIGSCIHYTFTDLIDNVSSKGTGERKGDDKNDRFVYTHFALTYNLTWGKNKEINEIEEFEFFEDTIDSDGDLVTDFNDKCAKTPPEALPVDEKGCPLDYDGDLVWDFQDDELDTEDSALVNMRGVTYTDDSIFLAYRMYMDSIGEFSKMEIVKHSQTVEAVKVPEEHHYRHFYIIGDKSKEFSVEEMHDVLANKTFRQIFHGDSVLYLVEVGSELAENVDTTRQIVKIVPGDETKGEKDKIINVNPTQAEVDSIAIVQAARPHHIDDEHLPQTFLYRVQIGAFHREIKSSVFEGLPALVGAKGEDGLWRYYSGKFDHRDDAAKHRAKMLEQGFIGAFMVAFKDGKRVTLGTSGFTVLPGFVDDIVEDSVATDGVVLPEYIKFRINVGDFSGALPTEVLDLYLTMGNVLPIKNSTTGVTSYFMGGFNDLSAAEEYMKELEREGIIGPFIVGDFNGNIISQQAAMDLLNQ